MICKKCKKEFKGNFCFNCGTLAKQLKKCPICGIGMQNGKWCSHCGYYYKNPNLVGFDYSFNERGVIIERYLGKEERVVIPQSVKGQPVVEIGQECFLCNKNIKSVEIPDGVKVIGKRAFDRCAKLSSVNIPDGVAEIGNGTFYRCGSLTNLEIPKSVTSIEMSAFFECKSLQYNEYDNALYLGNRDNPYMVLVKAKSKRITSCKINENTKIICNHAFYDCRKLKNIEIPDGVTDISCAFINSGLTSVTISSSVVNAKDAFAGCEDLTIYFETDKAPEFCDKGWNKEKRPVVYGYKGE